MSDRLEFEQHDVLVDVLRVESVEVTQCVAEIGLRRSALLASIPVSEVTAPVQSVTSAVTKFVVAACMGIALGVGFVAGRITAPVSRAANVALADAPVARWGDAFVMMDAAPAPVDALRAPDSPARPGPRVPRTPADRYSALDEPLLIEEARAALRRNLAAEAQRALNVHRTRFPAGQMVEERVVLSIEVAIQLGVSGDEIRALIVNYKVKFPQGSLRGRVNQLEETLTSP